MKMAIVIVAEVDRQWPIFCSSVLSTLIFEKRCGLRKAEPPISERFSPTSKLATRAVKFMTPGSFNSLEVYEANRPSNKSIIVWDAEAKVLSQKCPVPGLTILRKAFLYFFCYIFFLNWAAEQHLNIQFCN